MSSHKKIIKNALANGGGLICEAVISFSMLPYVLHRLGESAYGVWVFVIALSGYMGILNLGFRPAINKYVAQYNATGDWQKIRDMLQASLCGYLICAFIIVTTCSILALNMTTLFNIPKEFQTTASTLIFLVGLQMASGLIAVVFGGVISGLQRYEINNGIEIFVMLARTALIITFLDRFPSLATLAAAHFSMTIVGYIITVVIAYKIADISPLCFFRKPDKKAVITIFKFSAIMLVISTVGRVIMYIDGPLIAGILTTTAVTHYTIGSRLIKYLGNLIQVLVNVLTPATSDFDANNDHHAIQNLFLYSSKIASLIIFPALFFFIFLGREFLTLWIGGNNEESFKVMTVFVISSFFYLPQLTTTPILLGTAKHKIIMYLSLCSGFLSVLVAVLAGKTYGLAGVAVGLAFPQALLLGIFCPIFVCKSIEVEWGKWFQATYIQPFLSVVPFIVFFYFAKRTFLLDTWSTLVAVTIINICFYLFLAWRFVFSVKERRSILSLLKSTRVKTHL